jgi:TnpA family transposase
MGWGRDGRQARNHRLKERIAGMAFLDAQARAVLFEPPDTHEEALARYALTPEDVAFARRRRRSHNRLGFAVQLALVRDLGRPLRPGETIPAAVLDTVADQIGIDPVVFELYARRDETRREHLAEIVAQLDLRTMRERDYRLCIRAAATGAVATEKGEPIVLAVIDALKAARIVVPGAGLVERLALAGRAMARRQAYRHLIAGLAPATLASLDELLSERSGERTLLGWIADAPEGSRPKSLKAVIARLEVVRRAGITDERRKTIHANRYGVIAREARILHAREMQRFSADRRYATLTAFVIERQAALTDLAIDLFGRLLGTARRKAEWSRTERRLREADILARVAVDHVRLGQALLAARASGADLSAAITSTLGWEVLETSVAVASGLVHPDRHDEFDELVDRQRSLRAVARLVFAAFSFRSFRPTDQILASIELLRAVYGGGRLPKTVPLSFLTRKWRRRVRSGSGDLDVRAWEVAVLVHLRDRLRAGDIWVEGSRAWRSFEDYLLPRPTFNLMRAEGRLGLAVPDSFDAWRKERTVTLDARLKAIAQAAAADAIPDATLTDKGLRSARSPPSPRNLCDGNRRAGRCAAGPSVRGDMGRWPCILVRWTVLPAGGRGEASLDYNAKYGKRPGASLYGFLSNRFASFFSQLISASESEAPYVLDGLVHNESSIEIHEHATDTAGATETTFAMFHAFGYRLIPRIRNLGDRRLFVIAPDSAYDPLVALIGGTINMNRIEPHWDEVLRLGASVAAGLVPPSVILKKIAATPRQNGLSVALREIGRIERSIFICDWLLDPKLRRRSHAILNKGESRHALARAVFLHQLGELRNRVAETMAYRASGLNLVVNAIIL